MASEEDDTGDPWSGFVDVLSNVVMVVTFIVIILGVGMFALAEQVAKNIAQTILEKEREIQAIEEQKRAVEAERDAMAARGDGMAETPGLMRATRSSTEGREAGDIAEGDGGEGSDGVYETVVIRPELVDDEIKGETDLTIRSHEPEEQLQIEIAATEDRGETAAGNRVASGRAVLTLTFPADAHALDEASKRQVREALDPTLFKPGSNFELRGIASSATGSISEARRIAFYRAMAIRNLLLEAGLDPGEILVKVRPAGSAEEANKVFVFKMREEN